MLQNPDLLTEGGKFKAEVMPRAKKRAEPMKNAQKELKHPFILQEQKAMIDCNGAGTMSLISRSDLVLATYTSEKRRLCNGLLHALGVCIALAGPADNLSPCDKEW